MLLKEGDLFILGLDDLSFFLNELKNVNFPPSL
jgi:hypothetical protein